MLSAENTVFQDLRADAVTDVAQLISRAQVSERDKSVKGFDIRAPTPTCISRLSLEFSSMRLSKQGSKSKPDA